MTNSGANAHFWGIKMCPRCYEEYCKVGASTRFYKTYNASFCYGFKFHKTYIP